MTEQMKTYYEKRAQVLVKNLKSRHFEAYYCPDSASALVKALELIPEGASVGWGGALSAQQIGLIDAVKSGSFAAIDRDAATTPEERTQALKRCLTADVFLCGANEGLIPLDAPGRRGDPEEEKRLFYVGLTRAKEELIVINWSKPSPYLARFPSALVKRGRAQEGPARQGRQLSFL